MSTLAFPQNSLLGNEIAKTLCHAIALWDFMPRRTVSIVRRVGDILRRAIETAEKAKSDDICIYSFSRISGDIMHPDEFIDHIINCIAMVDGEAKRLEQKPRGEPDRTSDNSELRCLMMLNF